MDSVVGVLDLKVRISPKPKPEPEQSGDQLKRYGLKFFR